MRRTIINIILATDMCDHSRLTKVLSALLHDFSSRATLSACATTSSATERPVLPASHAMSHAFWCMPLLDC